MDFHSAFCPVCDRQIAPKRTTQLVAAPAIIGTTGSGRRNVQNRPPPKTKTIIDQGPCPLYCSDHCKMTDMLRHHEDTSEPLTYPIFRSTRKPENAEGSSPSDAESDSFSSTSATTATTTDISHHSPTDEFPPSLSASTPINYKQRSRSFISGRSSRSVTTFHAPSSLPSTSTFVNAVSDSPPAHDDYLLSQFHHSFSRRSESRVSMYSGPSSPTSRSPPSTSALSTSPRRERPLIAHGVQGKLLVPDVYVRVPTRPCTSRRESSSSLASLTSISSAPGAMTMRHRTGSMASVASSRASLKSPLARYGNDSCDDEDSEEDEYPCEELDAPQSPGFGGFNIGTSPKRPNLGDMRAWSFDAFSRAGSSSGSTFPTIRERRKSEKKELKPNYNPDGKRLFLFPTD
ncbi:hypothetical protein BDP27DRAFT_1365116 [Rhodocollybia butyracea]|uniref:Uncharacterized protein n=1 Tax=Rhodocollybia butyracea TaxID=206335 RepID=A0A9P5PJX9_9AGAR|nr:hypothetical protein BDP27DRAFT_1365116 [Rhodocollybia butyracea]